MEVVVFDGNITETTELGIDTEDKALKSSDTLSTVVIILAALELWAAAPDRFMKVFR